MCAGRSASRVRPGAVDRERLQGHRWHRAKDPGSRRRRWRLGRGRRSQPNASDSLPRTTPHRPGCRRSRADVVCEPPAQTKLAGRSKPDASAFEVSTSFLRRTPGPDAAEGGGWDRASEVCSTRRVCSRHAFTPAPECGSQPSKVAAPLRGGGGSTRVPQAARRRSRRAVEECLSVEPPPPRPASKPSPSLLVDFEPRQPPTTLKPNRSPHPPAVAVAPAPGAASSSTARIRRSRSTATPTSTSASAMLKIGQLPPHG